MDDQQILAEMIKDSAKINLEKEYDKPVLVLKELNATDSSVTINGLPDEIIAFRADAFKSPDTFFKGSKGECKRADFIIVSASARKKRILYVEMKKRKNDEMSSIVEQLSGAYCLMGYCQWVGKFFWKKEDFLDDYEHRFVSVFNASLPKRGTRVERGKEIHDKPEKLLKIRNPGRLTFNQLVGA